MLNIKPIYIETFGSVPLFNTEDLMIAPMFNTEDLAIRENHVSKNPRVKIQVRKKLMTINELFDSIERRFNKFKYAYYKKGVSSLNKEKIAFCHKTSTLMLKKLKTFRKYLKDNNDPKLQAFDKRLDNVEKIVKTYGNYIDKLNKGQCAKIGLNKK